MRGHVRKRGNSWAYWYEAGRDDSGRRKQCCRSGFPTKKAAENALAATLTDMAARLTAGGGVSGKGSTKP